MSFRLLANPNDPPVGALITAELINGEGKAKVEIILSNDLSSSNNVRLLGPDGTIICESDNEVGRYFGRTTNKEYYGGDDICERTEVDHWLSFSYGPLKSQKSLNEALSYLDNVLKPKTWLVSKHLTLADIYVFSSLIDHRPLENDESRSNISRWYKQMLALPAVQKVLATLPKNRVAGSGKATKSSGRQEGKEPKRPCNTGNRKQEGKFIELPGAEMGKVVVRFPPEASGYLHIGHAKAALLNQYYADAFQGQLIMRFDDTNPAKENVEFEKAILHDLELLQIKPDRFTHSSDYFDLMLSYCEKLIKDGKAFVDDTPAVEMKEQREQRLPSANRDNSIEVNLKLWEEMKKGTERGQECCVRAKIDYESTNGCMRDPTIYRCKPEPHPRTGTTYKVYPTYDFACPIVDAVEGVTHTLRTTEYHDRDVQFYWLVEALGLRRPYIWEYSRLNMTNTVLSKRRLTWLVDEGLVDGWDDPRFPTVRGILRRGMTVEGLKQFIIAQGSSRSVVFMEWDKIWSFNKKVIDPIAVRYTALEESEIVPVSVENAKEETLTVQNHPKDPSKGTKRVKVGPRILIERCDAETLVEGQNATFINWGNLLIKKIEKNNGIVTGVQASLNLDNKDYKNTVKLTWLADDRNEKRDKCSERNLLPCYAVYFEHIISKAVLGKDEDFKDFVAKDTRREVKMLGENEIQRIKKGEIIQLQRKGFFRCDVPYSPPSPFSSREQPCILFHVPDGHSAASTVTNAENSTKVEKKSGDASAVHEKILAQGIKVRDLKAAKAEKSAIDGEVKVLLALKAEFKGITGTDWKPDVVVETRSTGDSGKKSVALSKKVQEQADNVRKLKAEKAEKKVIDAEVKELLSLKAEYKKLTGNEWKATDVCQPAGKQESSSQIDSAALSEKIAQQGDKVRQLKADKKDKKTIDLEVKTLLALKVEYKNATGTEWKPQPVNSAPKEQVSNKSDGLSSKIQEQGDKIRQLKSSKADKKIVDQEVKTLLALKAEYKAATGEDWKPVEQPAKMSSETADSLSAKIAEQGDKVRELKAQKAEKAKIDEGVKILLKLKSDYKSLTRQEWKPVTTPASTAKTATTASNSKGNELSNEITKAGDKVRRLKSEKAEKNAIDEAVKILLDLKSSYKAATGQEWKPPGGDDRRKPKNSGAPKPAEKNQGKKDNKAKDEQSSKEEAESNKTGTRLGLEAKKNENLSEWYSQVITKGEMIEYYDVSGCYILRPWSFSIWDVIKDFFDREIKKLGVQNCYFPIFVSKSVLEREKDHIADFAPEVAWVTKSGESDLAEPIAIRPTSETVMYPAYAKWLKSHRDLPLKLNQWNNVVRWEFKHPQPFLRTREFLWQEGHSAFATKAEADEEVLTILELYAKVYEHFLAIPVVRGRKTTKEKFAGGDYTTTVEAFVSASGRAIQGATSHHLGQNFSKMFDIRVEGADEGGEKIYVYQNSWGLTTRTIGVMIMVHSDDKGLVLPPKVAAVQAVIVPCGITASTSAEQRQRLMAECEKLEADLKKSGELKIRGDYRENYSPGWKFNHWELKGVPVRIELGFKDLEKKQVTLVRRDNSERLTASRDKICESVVKLLDDVQKSLYEKASKDLKDHTKQTTDWKVFCTELDKKNIILAPFCGETSCEDNIKADSTREDAGEEPGAPAMGAKGLCIPFEQPKISIDSLKCVHPKCTRKPLFFTLFGRSY